MDGVEFVYALNLSRCIGCRKCVHACVEENNQTRVAGDPVHPRAGDGEGQHRRRDAQTITTIRQQVPDPDKYYMPVQCHQCAKPPCVKVCPVEATWQEPDGITVIDYDWCIGCRYCEAACPYWARRFNFAEPEIPDGRAQPGHGLPLQPAAAEGRDGEVHVLPAPHARGPDAGLPRGLPDRGAQVRQRPRSRQRGRLDPAAQARLRPQGGGRHAAALLLLLRRTRQSLSRSDRPRDRAEGDA